MVRREEIQRGQGVVLSPMTGGVMGEPPTNPRLYGQPAVVVAVTAWGAVVQPIDGGPTYRAGWDEMTVRQTDGARPAGGLELMANGFGGTADEDARLPKPGTNGHVRSPTGDVCPDCGGANMTRDGTCLVCLDCGGRKGGCG